MSDRQKTLTVIFSVLLTLVILWFIYMSYHVPATPIAPPLPVEPLSAASY